MNRPAIFVFHIIFFFLIFSVVEAQVSPPTASNGGDGSVSKSFRPSVAVVIGVLSITFSLTFLLLMYAKFCHNTTSDHFNGGHQQSALFHSRSRFSGIDKAVIESLPFFTFSSLKGSKQGLECAVCLSKFEDSEILRLLPKCKHAFHIACVDQWLESHSSCPLCRHRFVEEDVVKFAYSNSLRFSRDPSGLREDPNVELFVQREPDNDRSSSRFSSFRKTDNGKKNDELLMREDDQQQFLDKFKHRIIVSDVVFKNRWSDVNSADLMFLNSEMLNFTSSKRFLSFESNNSDGKDGINTSLQSNAILSIREEMEKKRALESMVSKMNGSVSISFPDSSSTGENSSKASNFLIPSEKRSRSEITNLSRFADLSNKTRIKNSSLDGKEEQIRRLWLPIARRTVLWLAGREKRLQFNQDNCGHFLVGPTVSLITNLLRSVTAETPKTLTF